MDLATLNRALAEKENMELYQKYERNLSDFDIVGMTMRRKGGGNGDIVLMKGSTGTGTVTGFGFSDALGQYLTEKLMDWLADHVQDAKKVLRTYGVEVKDD